MRMLRSVEAQQALSTNVTRFHRQTRYVTRLLVTFIYMYESFSYYQTFLILQL